MDTSSLLSKASLIKGASVIKDTANLLSSGPGVYRMLGAKGEVLYVGKAKNLKRRVLSYTQVDKLPRRLQQMVAHTLGMEIVHTSTEVEALLLETNLIKKFNPRYNILFKDGKTLPYIFLSDGPWPGLFKRRKNISEKGTYFGPFASVEALEKTLLDLYKAFLLRSCSDAFFAARKRPCLQYHIKRCSAPCVGKITQEAYQQMVRQALRVLKGKSKDIQAELIQEMDKASNAQLYEKAGVLRDRIRALAHIQAHQVIHAPSLGDTDVLALAHAGGSCCIQVFFFRKGSNYGTRAFFPKHGQHEDPLTVFQAFVTQFYKDVVPPPLVLLSHRIPDQALIEQALCFETASPKARVRLQVPTQGMGYKVLQQALLNAKEALNRHLAEKASMRKIGDHLAKWFGLNAPPQRIEVYDNSHLQGTNAFGAMIVATPEGFLKSAYRKFKIQTTRIGDDFSMMKEVMARRFQRALEEDPNRQGPQWPDLVILDGGKGQLSAAREVLVGLGLGDLPLVAMAKGEERDKGGETFYRWNNATPLHLDDQDPVLYYLQQLRDEAHRYVISAHRRGRVKQITTSGLDDIQGVGPVRKKRLIQHLGSLASVRHATLEDLAAVPGIDQALARKIFDYFQSNAT